MLLVCELNRRVRVELHFLLGEKQILSLKRHSVRSRRANISLQLPFDDATDLLTRWLEFRREPNQSRVRDHCQGLLMSCGVIAVVGIGVLNVKPNHRKRTKLEDLLRFVNWPPTFGIQ